MVKRMASIIYNLSKICHRLCSHYAGNWLLRHIVAECGHHVLFPHDTSPSGLNLHIGNHVSVGPEYRFMCTRALIVIGDYVMFGPM